ncbi:toprim domain-containing protein [uncultured Aquitalea sp.]|uniref:toprim domain-containing protein n=1 Tax=uncultured Aquitalea sp. TaxID=540272 RepID=UPI0025DCF3C5|nr:toprim domain-containing protein [uncultured Aquitalea sp.]
MTTAKGAMGDWFAQLKRDIDLHDLADKLGLQRQGSRGNYHSPHHPDSSPSLSIFDGGRGWKDWSGDAGGSCIDLVQYCRPELTTPLAAARLLGEWYSVPQPAMKKDSAGSHTAPTRKSTLDYIAERSLAKPEPVVAYLTGRGIDEATVRRAIQCKTLGWNDWFSAKLPPDEVGHGGPAAAFIVRGTLSAGVVAVDLRYADPALNGGVKTQCQGEREGHGWTADPMRLKRAQTVVIVESPVNALSVDSVTHHSVASLALRGTGNVDSIDWTFLRGKRVLVALDHTDPVNPHTGQRPGLAAAWRLSETLIAADIGHLLVDMQDWEEGEDINDVLQRHGGQELTARLRKLEPWLVPGMPGGGERLEGTRRIQLPGHDFAVYWRFRVKEDFTQYVDEFKTDDDGNRSETLGDLCSFRVAGLSRLRIQSHLATISGTPDHQPETVFGVSAQLARHGVILHREVATDDKLYNLEWWKSRFGAIWKPAQFQRLVNLMERAADLGARDVVNFVGLAWKAGELAAQEGQDCYFVEPQKQCLYYNLTFPRGNRHQARSVILAYQDTFKHNAATIALVWGLGSHLKTVLGFYPHLQMQAEKGSGKSRLLESLQNTLAFQVLSGQMLKTDHRRRASVSFTSQPVGWDEFSKLPKNILADIDALLQSTYRFEFTRVGAALTPYLMCAPVLLAGEEVDVQSLQSKLCRSSLSVARQGNIIPHDLTQFPLWPWLQFLGETPPARLRDLHQHYVGYCRQHCRAPEGDATAKRMMENYAAILTSWALLCEFAEIDLQQGGFIDDLLAEMNSHIVDTDGTRLPWVWIMEILLSELDAHRYEHPYCWDTFKTADGHSDMALFIRPNHVMDHLSTANHLRGKYDALPVKTGRIFKSQLLQSGVVLADDIEKTIHGRRHGHLTAISLAKLEKLGLYASPDTQRNH